MRPLPNFQMIFATISATAAENLPVNSESDGEPDGRRVTDGRQVLRQAVIDEAPSLEVAPTAL